MILNISNSVKRMSVANVTCTRKIFRVAIDIRQRSFTFADYEFFPSFLQITNQTLEDAVITSNHLISATQSKVSNNKTLVIQWSNFSDALCCSKWDEVEIERFSRVWWRLLSMNATCVFQSRYTFFHLISLKPPGFYKTTEVYTKLQQDIK